MQALPRMRRRCWLEVRLPPQGKGRSAIKEIGWEDIAAIKTGSATGHRAAQSAPAQMAQALGHQRMEPVVPIHAPPPEQGHRF